MFRMTGVNLNVPPSETTISPDVKGDVRSQLKHDSADRKLLDVSSIEGNMQKLAGSHIWDKSHIIILEISL